MAPHGKIKRWGLLIFLLIQLAVISGLAVMMILEHHRGDALAQALQDWENGDFEAARQGFHRVLEQDPASEKAYVGLAEIAGREQNWPRAAEAWQNAFRLNPLQVDYRRKARTALACGWDFTALAEQFGDAPEIEELDDENAFLCILSLFHLQKTDDAKRRLKALCKRNQDFPATPPGRLLAQLLAERPDAAGLRALAGESSVLIAGEALSGLIRLHIQSDDMDGLEATLQELSRCNRFRGVPGLADFHMQTYRFAAAAELFQQDWQTYRRPVAAMMAGENLLLAGEPEKLAELQKLLRQNDKGSLLAGYYLKSLSAFGRDDRAALLEAWPYVDSRFQTPLSRLVALYAAIAQDSPSQVMSAWEQLFRHSFFYDFERRARLLLDGYIRILIAQNRVREAAQLLGMNHVDPWREPVQARCYITGRLLAGTLHEKDLAEAARRFPADPVLLQCAAEYHLGRGDLARAEECLQTALRQNPPKNSGIHYLRIRLLTRQGKADQAAPLYLEALQNHPGDAALLVEFVGFCHDFGRFGELRRAVELLRRNDPAGLLPYLEGEMLYQQGDREEALALLESVRSDHPGILFRTVLLLRSGGRDEAARQRCRRLLAGADGGLKVAALTMLTDLEPNPAAALEHAREAWQMAPREPETIRRYAEKLLAVQKFEEALDILSRPLPDRAPDLRALWRKAAEGTLPGAWSEERFEIVRLRAEAVLREFPDSAAAAEYLRKITMRNQTEPAE